jgi:hypothetical protein
LLAGDSPAGSSLAGNGRTVEVTPSSTALFARWSASDLASRRTLPRRNREATSNPRELPDVTGFLVVVLVTLGLFVAPVGATIMQGPAIVASILGR